MKDKLERQQIVALFLGILVTQLVFAAEPKISSGASGDLILKSDGTVWARGSAGLLGAGTSSTSEVPRQVPGLVDMAAVAAGSKGGMALKRDGTVWVWGDYQKNSTAIVNGSPTPLKVAGLSDVVDIAAPGVDYFAIKRDGTVWVWWPYTDYVGEYRGGEPHYTTPIQVANIANAVSFSHQNGGKSASGLFSLPCREQDGTVWSIDFKSSTTAGNKQRAPWPIKLASKWDEGVVNTFASDYFMLEDNGTVNEYTFYNASDPPIQQVLLDVAEMVASRGLVYFRKHDGTIWVSGRGPTGDGTNLDRRAPSQIPGIEGATMIASRGGNNGIFAKADGTLWNFGYGVCQQSEVVCPVTMDGGAFNIGSHVGGMGVRVLNWAERLYPTLFKSTEAVAGSVSGYDYRFYPSTGNYLATKAGHLYLYGPQWQSVADLGLTARWDNLVNLH